MKHELRCDCCQEDLKTYSSKFVVGIERIKVCESCADDYVNKVKRKYYVETYNGHDIYTKDGMYFPYWDRQYCFPSLQDCRNRIDAKVGIYFL